MRLSIRIDLPDCQQQPELRVGREVFTQIECDSYVIPFQFAGGTILANERRAHRPRKVPVTYSFIFPSTADFCSTAAAQELKSRG